MIANLERYARSRDAETSWAAGASIAADTLSELQAWVMVTLREQPLADRELVDAHEAASKAGDVPRLTPQRIRTARHELVLAGLVEWNGGFHKIGNRLHQVWQTS